MLSHDLKGKRTIMLPVPPCNHSAHCMFAFRRVDCYEGGRKVTSSQTEILYGQKGKNKAQAEKQSHSHEDLPCRLGSICSLHWVTVLPLPHHVQLQRDFKKTLNKVLHLLFFILIYSIQEEKPASIRDRVALPAKKAPVYAQMGIILQNVEVLLHWEDSPEENKTFSPT